ncbi:MAG TPA: DNA polymerase I, partial [Spirochaetota bacterium]|nr:DNA polymerase I [Spirochaetota bacterium]
MKKRLFVVDGHALCYRAYFAFIKNPLVTADGQNVSAIYGFALMLLKLINDQRPDYLAVAFDPPRKSFRFRMYPEYKATRQKMPDDLRSQIDEIKHMLSVLGIVRVEEEDFEADDVLGTLATTHGSKSLEVVLVTGDKDAYQLVGPHVRIYAGKKGITEFDIYDAKAVEEKLGITPTQVIDYMALTGDASDNVPGVKGVGEKTALQLITDYRTLDGVYAHVDEITGKLKDKLIESKEMAYLSRDLVTIRTDLPLQFDIERAALPDLKTPAVRSYFAQYEMKSIIKDIFGDGAGGDDGAAAAPGTDRATRDYRTVRTADELAAACAAIRAAGEVSVDTETTSVNPVDAELVGISLSIAPNAGWYVPVACDSLFSEAILDRDAALEVLRPMLEDPAVRKIGQNIKYDMIVLAMAGIEIAGVSFDTMVASYLLAPGERRHNMDDLAAQYLNYTTITYAELVGKGKNAVPITAVPLDRLSEYAIEDADITLRLRNVLAPLLDANDLRTLFETIEMPLVRVLAVMERNGVKIDTAHFARLAQENEGLLRDAEEKVYAAAEIRFNINSTRELADVLFNRLRLKTVKKTKTGYSTDISVLEALQGAHPIIDHLIAYRTLSKIRNTYIDTLPQLVSPNTGRIHTSYNQTVVATGRLSSSDPNLQNIPVRDDYSRKIRAGFVPEKGRLILSADYSQIELRIAAHISNDANMIRAFRDGIDIHSMTAAAVFGVPIDGVLPEMRRQAKIINFATIYGVSPFGLSQQADIGIKEAALFIQKYLDNYTGI